MIRKASLLIARAPTSAFAQSSHCQWIGNIRSCQQYPQSQVPTPD